MTEMKEKAIVKGEAVEPMRVQGKLYYILVVTIPN